MPGSTIDLWLNGCLILQKPMQVGTVLRGRYRITSFLGRGGFGETYLAEDLDLPGNPPCVVKLLKPQNSSSSLMQVARVLFRREAKILYQLGNISDQIPQLYAHAEENEQFYLVQEFINGHTLRKELVRDQSWHEAAVLQMIKEILEVLAVVHKNGVVHRDIKPSNLMRRYRDKKMVLIDFGSVKEINALTVDPQGHTTTTVAIGSANYISPEQAYGNPQFASDVYSVGVLGIQALLGRVPQKDPVTGSLIWKNLVTASPDLVEVLDKMTRYHFKDRYSSAESALEALGFPLQISEPVPVRDPKKRWVTSALGVPIVFAGIWMASKLLPIPLPPSSEACPFKNCTLKIGGLATAQLRGRLQTPKRLCKDDVVQSLSQPLQINREPLRRYLETSLRQRFPSVQVKLDDTLNFSQRNWTVEASDKVKNKDWDIAFTLSPLVATVAKDQGYKFAFASNLGGQTNFSSSIYVRKKSDIVSLNNINSSKKIALGNRKDLVGFYQPIYLLYGTNPSIESNYNFSKIRSLVLCRRVDIGVGPTQSIQQDPTLTILATSTVSVGGIYFSPQLRTETQDLLKALLTKAPERIRDAAAYTQSAEPSSADYEKLKQIMARAQEIVQVSQGEIVGVIKNVSRFSNRDYAMTVETQDRLSYQVLVPASVMRRVSNRPLSDLLAKQVQINKVKPDGQRRLVISQKAQISLKP